MLTTATFSQKRGHACVDTHVLTENSKKSDTILVDVPLMSMADLDALVVLAFDRTRVACIVLFVKPAVGTAVS